MVLLNVRFPALWRPPPWAMSGRCRSHAGRLLKPACGRSL